MHGEYKTPGGKLVVVDCTIREGRLADVEVTGDFFLYPEEALDTITRALTGLPTSLPADEIAALIHAHVGDGVTFLGFSPEAIGIAVTRAMSEQAAGSKQQAAENVGAYRVPGAQSSALDSRWRSYDWHLIPAVARDPAMNMALDAVLTERVGAGKRPATLWIWGWNAPCVVLGRFQSVRNEIDEEDARALGISFVRRITGGGAMFIQPGGAITYSVIAPESLVAGMSFAESYAFLDSWAVAGLRALGVDATYVPLNDISSSTGKIGGAAQARRGGAVLHHATIACELDIEQMARVLRIGREKLSDKGIASAAKRVSPLRQQTDLPRDTIIERLVASFADRYGLTPDTVHPDEEAEAARRVHEQFDTHEWRYILP